MAVRWWFWGMVSTPPAALFHEFGHFLVFWSLGLPGAALHHGSAGFTGLGDFFRAVREGDLAGAAEIAPVWGVALSLAMGLVATYVMVFACCCLCAKWRAHPLLVAMGYMSNLRILAALLAIGVRLIGVRASAGCDECWLERITGVPLAVWALPGVVSLVWAGIFLWKYFPRQHRWVAVTATGVGIGTGLGVWGGLLGPLLLP
ncbi:MAG: hypothetical protein OXP70_09105 [Acidobacteriota bacterium]|nr:hypothetical protein [Acidobacteriota bacterium]